MGTWFWYFRKWRVEKGCAVPDPVFVESYRNARLPEMPPGFIITPDGSCSVQEFLSGLLGRPVSRIGKKLENIEDDDLDTDIVNHSPGRVADLDEFLANEGVHFWTFVDRTDGTPAFSLFKLQRQPRLLDQLKERLPEWERDEDPNRQEWAGWIRQIVRMLERGYRLGVTA